MMNNKILDLLNEIIPEHTSLNRHLNSKVLIVDGINTFLRSFAVVNYVNQFGNHVGGLTGFLFSLGYAISITKPTRVIIIFDGENGSVNKRYLYPEYKKNRENAGMVNSKMHLDKSEEDEAKINQISRLMDYLSMLPVNILCIDKFEADDVMGYVSNYLKKKHDDCNTVIMSSDRDFFQLIDSRTSVYSPTKKKFYYTKEVLEEFGVHPNNFLIYKTILGDTGDNVKGINGIGEKKTPSMFPDLKKEKELKLKNIFEIAENNVNNGKLYAKVLEGKSKLDINYQIMNLRKPNLSKESISIIQKELKTDPNKFNRLDFIRMHKMDDLTRSMPNIESWLLNFTPLQIYKNK